MENNKLQEQTEKIKAIIHKSLEIAPIVEAESKPETTFGGAPKIKPEEDKFKERETRELLFLVKLGVDASMKYNVSDICLQLLEYIASGTDADDDILIKKATMTPIYTNDSHTVTLSEHGLRDILVTADKLR